MEDYPNYDGSARWDIMQPFEILKRRVNGIETCSHYEITQINTLIVLHVYRACKNVPMPLSLDDSVTCR